MPIGGTSEDDSRLADISWPNGSVIAAFTGIVMDALFPERPFYTWFTV